jgi:hypothetical protein
MQPWRYSWHRAVELQRALYQVAGDPPDALLPENVVRLFRWPTDA